MVDEMNEQALVSDSINDFLYFKNDKDDPNAKREESICSSYSTSVAFPDILLAWRDL